MGYSSAQCNEIGYSSCHCNKIRYGSAQYIKIGYTPDSCPGAEKGLPVMC